MINMEQEVEVKWNRRSRKWYECKGYIFTNYGDKFIVKIIDLTPKNDVKVLVICDYCGREYLKTYNHVFRHREDSLNKKDCCYDCRGAKNSDIQRMDYSIVEQLFIDRGYKLLDNQTYINRHTKLWYTCPKHPDHKRYITYANLLKGRGCAICRESTGEKAITKWLDENNITYSRQYTFSDLVSDSNYPLRFDFAIHDIDNKLILLIEFDGIQHFKSVDIFGGDNELNKRLKLDNLKNKYCESHNIPLLRIPYTEFSNLEDILTKKIGGLN